MSLLLAAMIRLLMQHLESTSEADDGEHCDPI
jgi:hypothetical protein